MGGRRGQAHKGCGDKRRQASDRARDKGRGSVVWEHCSGRSKAGRTHPPSSPRSVLVHWECRAVQGLGAGQAGSRYLWFPSMQPFSQTLDSSLAPPVGEAPPTWPPVLLEALGIRPGPLAGCPSDICVVSSGELLWTTRTPLRRIVRPPGPDISHHCIKPNYSAPPSLGPW